MVPIIRRGCFLFLFAVATAQAAQPQGFMLLPMEQTVELGRAGPGGSDAVARFQIQNDSDGPKTLKLELFTRAENIAGFESRSPSRDFQIDTPVVMLASGEGREVALKFKGDTAAKAERAYRFVVSEMSGALRLKMVASLYVRPLGARADLVVISPVKWRSDRSRFEFVLQNRGTAHQRLAEFTPVLRGIGAAVEISDESLTNWNRENVLANSKRRIELQAKAAVSPKVELSVDLVPSRPALTR